jgi:hypothetical protein
MTWNSSDDPGARARSTPPVLPVVVGLLAGLAVQCAAFVALLATTLRADVDLDSGSTSFTTRLAVAGTLGIALATGVAARVCSWRCQGHDLTPRAVQLGALLAGGATGAVCLGLGLAIALRWPTLPLYLAGIAGGIALERWAARRRSRPA